MKRKFKRALALALSAGMVLTIPAPMEVQAAPGSIHFIFNDPTLNPGYVGNENIDVAGSGATHTSAAFAGVDKDATTNANAMPYWNLTTNSFDVTKAYPGHTWNSPGYKIEGWYNNNSNAVSLGFKIPRLDITSFPAGEVNYYAKLQSDGTRYHIETRYLPKTGVYVPSLDNPAINSVSVDREALTRFDTGNYDISGFKKINVSESDNGDGGATLEFFEPVAAPGPYFVTPSSISNPTWAMDGNKTVSGTVFNKDVRITYKYDVDTSTQFSIKVRDNIYANETAVAGAYAIPATHTPLLSTRRISSDGYLPVYGQAATLSPQIKPNQDLLTATAPAIPRYVLSTTKPVSITFSKGTPNGAGDFVDASNNVIGKLLPNRDITGVYTKLGFDADNQLIGQMPNQNITVTYNYVPNPAFSNVVSIKYEDSDGIDITDKVIAKLGAAISNTLPTAANVLYKDVVGTPPNTRTYIAVKMNASSTAVNVPVPVLDGYKTSPAPEIIAENGSTWADSYAPSSFASAMAGWSASAPYYTISTDTDGDGAGEMPSTSETLTVTYIEDPATKVTVDTFTTEGGKLMVDDITAIGGKREIDSRDVIALYKQNVNPVTGVYDVRIDGILLPEPVADEGYTFDKWQYNGNDINFATPQVITGIVPSSLTEPGNISLTAVFKKDTNAWNTYNLVEGDSHVSLINGNTAQVLNLDSSSTTGLATILFSALDDYTTIANNGITLDPGYNVKWFDENFNELTPTTDITAMSGKTFTAYTERTTPQAVYNPEVTSRLNPSTGAPIISIDPASPQSIDSRLKYVITDTNNVVVGVVSGTELISNGGDITGNFLNPGDTYNVYTALGTTPVAIGSPIPTSGVSASSSAQIPAVLDPAVSDDASHPGRATITVAPVSPNTDYALVGPDGSVVYPFATPGTNRITFDNLSPGAVYRVVVRPTGSTFAPTSRTGNYSRAVDTSNRGVAVSEFKLHVFSADEITIPSSVEINGTLSTDPDALNKLRSGDVVKLTAPLLDSNSEYFTRWQLIGGLSSITAVSNVLTLTMPNRSVSLQMMYDSNQWGTNYNDNIGSGMTFYASYPYINGSGTYRLTIDKDRVPANIESILSSKYDNFEPLWIAHIYVEEQDASGNWTVYEGADGKNVTANIETGSLLSTREYKFNEIESLASASNAVEISGDFENPGDSYPNEFTSKLKVGNYYVFGYSNLSDVSFVTIRENVTDTKVAELVIPALKSVSDFSSKYASGIKDDFVDNNGITWHYEGMSTDKNKYIAFDPTGSVSGIQTLYLFYSNDKAAREVAVKNLTLAIARADETLLKADASKKAGLQAAIDAANAILNQRNRAASTSELQAAFDALNAAIVAAGGKAIVPIPTPKPGDNNNGGRGGRGSSGGSGGTGSAGKKNVNSNSLRVGYDGNWELLNPEEKDLSKSRWVFNLTGGTRVTGWAYLSYTYDGQTKSEWYHFGTDGNMDSGWLFDGADWYYLSSNHDGFFGEMRTGWIFDNGMWYYLDPNGGAMRTGWVQEGGEYYYLNPTSQSGRPLGAMYLNETTPDGYNVNQSGAWR